MDSNKKHYKKYSKNADTKKADTQIKNTKSGNPDLEKFFEELNIADAIYFSSIWLSNFLNS